MNFTKIISKGMMVRYFGVGVGLLITSVSALAFNVTGTGFTPLGEVDTYQLTYDPAMSPTPHRNFNGPFYLMISSAPRNQEFSLCSNSPISTMLIPGTAYYGKPILKGVYLVFYDSTITSTFGSNMTNSSITPTTSVMTFNSKGQFSATLGQNGATLCVGNQMTGYWANYDKSYSRGVSGILKYGVYVTNEATSGTSIPLSFYIYRQSSTILHITETTQVNLVDCTITTPSLIDFGEINAGDTTPVIDPTSMLNVNCTGSAPSVSLSYSVTPISETVNTTALKMKNTQGQLQGYIRGFIGNNAGSEAGCQDTSSSIKFGQQPVTLLAPTSNNKSYPIDLKWVLCPDAMPGTGDGEASATLNVFWN